ncbi:MFS transporter [Filimonas effusa]|uniref:MFS transporter n=1 Tax=Filimonas effusa TaxID=2508721 RepID=A0A4Q1D1G5_9BACT|nr:MFS transporter [Filimonas effusa]RXK80845.1 MFS transporter [Filimonas effusa]
MKISSLRTPIYSGRKQSFTEVTEEALTERIAVIGNSEAAPPIEEKTGRGESRYRRIRFCIFLSGVSVFAQLYAFQPLLSQVSSYFGRSAAVSSLTVSSSTLGMATGLLFFAFMADNFSRKGLMVFSLFSSAALTLLSPLLPNYPLLVLFIFLKGVCVSGVSAVALAYLAEEVSAVTIGAAISFYLAGNTFGGMAGRIIAALIAGWVGWKWAIFSIGIIGLICAVIFVYKFPASRFFNSCRVPFRDKRRQMKQLFMNKTLLGLYAIAACLLGCFVSVYNYLGFRLEAAPFHLPHYLIAAIFLMYSFGIAGNILAGKLSDRFSSRNMLSMFILLVVTGLLLMMTPYLILIIPGLALFTLSFFSAQTMAGRQVTVLAPAARTSATALYWLFYYVGSSTIGSFSGVFIDKGNWNGFFGALLLFSGLSFVLALRGRLNKA